MCQGMKKADLVFRGQAHFKVNDLRYGDHAPFGFLATLEVSGVEGKARPHQLSSTLEGIIGLHSFCSDRNCRNHEGSEGRQLQRNHCISYGTDTLSYLARKTNRFHPSLEPGYSNKPRQRPRAWDRGRRASCSSHFRVQAGLRITGRVFVVAEINFQAVVCSIPPDRRERG